MAAIDKWLYNQRPDLQKNVTVVKDVKWLHITQDGSVKEMIPRIGWRQTGNEDRTTPRISGAETIRGCIYGHSAVRENILTQTNFNKDKWKDGALPIFFIYKMDGIDLLKPTKKLVVEAPISDELWIVPYCPETIVTKPTKIGRIIPYRITDDYVMGTTKKTNIFYIECSEPIILDKKNTVGPGKFQFSIEGDLSPFGKKVYDIADVGEISNQQWSLAMKSIRASN